MSALGASLPRTARSRSRKASGYGTVSAGPSTTRRLPSVAKAATSTPSSEVPLISPSAGRRFVLDEAAMSKVRSAFLTAAQERGFVHQCTDLEALDARLAGGAVTAYVGYDC